MNHYLVYFLGIIGLALLVYGIAYFNKLFRVKNWTPVEFSIIESHVKKIVVPEVNVMIEYYIPDVLYTYEILGTQYTSDTFSIDSKDWREQDKKIIESHMESCLKRKVCYVNPENYKNSVFTINTSKRRMQHYYGVTVSGIILILLSVILILIE